MPAVNSRRGRSRRTISEINMVPFIDVMLVLLIIFMVTAPLITPSMIALPKVGKAPSQPQNPVQILISKDETVQIKIKIKTDSVPSNVRNVAGDIARLEPAVKAEGAQAVPVVISADKSIKYETVVQVMDNLQKAGVSRVGLSVQTGGK
ncbi:MULTISPECIES: biopolymer transporter ExbD [unclassified Polaromonas]|uniref:biopolymer transporter ExbD n=1 Tax=unclassified Polaromonas TaxID=2638319 RepID=UPI000F088051|nr:MULTISPECIES: biopolymer transporter ExbD [unclassified Polaromonas]AYQ30129.1 protein TolR [Polaromonas sp. SP1]QGJ18757.1 protein TolR [Polaromonas sp. Pch-P]